MNTNKMKIYLPFILSSILFVVLITFSIFFYINWNNQKIDEKETVEVNLPVINWGAYSSLSKKHEPDKVNDELKAPL